MRLSAERCRSGQNGLAASSPSEATLQARATEKIACSNGGVDRGKHDVQLRELPVMEA